MKLEKYSMGVGDRFGREGGAQVRALEQAAARGVDIVPVWNKSYREHQIVGTTPADARVAADTGVNERAWRRSYYVDADHIGLRTVDLFLDSSDFFTIDVADFIGQPADARTIDAYVAAMAPHLREFPIDGVRTTTRVTESDLVAIARKYLLAVTEAAQIYRHIERKKGARAFVAEVSTDEASEPQTPAELFFILGALAREGVRIQTIAPKFTGKFLKGIDYVGAVERFAAEFEEDLLVIARAVQVFDLPQNLKLSVHSGSDKFSLYPVMHRAIRKRDAGLHLKTAGTTWLEELVGLAMGGGDGLELAKTIYAAAFDRIDELCQPYLAVIEIDRARLPAPRAVQTWTSEQFASALRHVPSDGRYNPHVRQLLHVGYKVAAEMGDRYHAMLTRSRAVIERHVAENLFERHIVPLFLGS